MAKLNQINVAVIGAGWVGGIRAAACRKNPLIDKLSIAEIDERRVEELKKELEEAGEYPLRNIEGYW